MLSLPPTVRVFVATEPVDMRGSFDSLAGATRRLGLDPVDGHLELTRFGGQFSMLRLVVTSSSISIRTRSG
jgi:hypothetical protein